VERQHVSVVLAVPYDDHVAAHESAIWVWRGEEDECVSSADSRVTEDPRRSLGDVPVSALDRRCDQTRQSQLRDGARLSRTGPGLSGHPGNREGRSLSAEDEVAAIVVAEASGVVERCPVEAWPEKTAARGGDIRVWGTRISGWAYNRESVTRGTLTAEFRHEQRRAAERNRRPIPN
jgi:hypothetical protein